MVFFNNFHSLLRSDDKCCPVCGLLINSKRFNFKQHLKIHTGEKPFVCQVCNRAFRQKAHMVSNLGEIFQNCLHYFRTLIIFLSAPHTFSHYFSLSRSNTSPLTAQSPGDCQSQFTVMDLWQEPDPREASLRLSNPE